MPDFKRLVSYMYTYEEGKKRSNVGYARVEARNGQCKFTIHISALSYNDKQVTVYAFKRNKNEVEGIQLGKFTIRNGIGAFRLVTDPSRILNTGYAIEEIGGIVLYQTEKRYLATVWDENPLTIDMVASLEAKDSNVLKAGEAPIVDQQVAVVEAVVKQEEAVIEIEEVAVEAVETVVEIEEVAEHKEEIEEIEEEKVVATDTIETKVPSEGISSSGNAENGNIENVVESQENKSTEKVDDRLECNEQNTNTTTSNNETIHDMSRRGEGCGCNKLNGNQTNNAYSNFSNQLDESQIAAKLYKEYPRMHPFEDNEISWCVRIEPKDIGILPVEVWPLSNNSFLLHGFYGHRHLIFAKVNNRNSNSYIIGVPGIYHNRERFMAKMFGFENFKCAKRRDRREGEFGYWYMPVNLK